MPNSPKSKKADLVIRNIGWLVTVDKTRRIVKDAGVAIAKGRIVAIGKSDAIVKAHADAQTFDARGAVATPGMVDCHLHSSFHLSRGLADEANAQSFLFDRMYPYEAAMEGEDVEVSATHACAELLRHGVTCFIDPGNYHPEASLKAARSTGIRMVVSRSSFDLTKSVMGILPAKMIEDTKVCLKEAEAIIERYGRTDNPRLKATSASHSSSSSASASTTQPKDSA